MRFSRWCNHNPATPLKPAPTGLKQAASEALRAALRVARTGERVSAIGKAVESEARRAGFAVVRELCGHGIGRKIVTAVA